MKKVILLFVFAISSIIAFANNTDPVKKTGEKGAETQTTIDCQEEAPDYCTYCTNCQGITICVTCICGSADCSTKFDQMYAIICSISPSCCYIVGPPPPNEPK